MMVQKILNQCTICGYITQSAINHCPACNDGQGHKWEAPNHWPYGSGTTAKATEDAVRRKCMEVFGAAFEMWSGVVDFKNGYIAKLDKQKETK